MSNQEELVVFMTLPFGVEETIVDSLQCLGMLAHFQGDFASAYPLYEEALAKRREAGRWDSAWANLLDASKRLQFAEHGGDQFRNSWVNVHCPLHHCVRCLRIH